MNRLDAVEKTQMNKTIPDFQPGDTVRVHVRVKESETKERLQRSWRERNISCSSAVVMKALMNASSKCS